jgi:hypothetical protein
MTSREVEKAVKEYKQQLKEAEQRAIKAEQENKQKEKRISLLKGRGMRISKQKS